MSRSRPSWRRPLRCLSARYCSSVFRTAGGPHLRSHEAYCALLRRHHLRTIGRYILPTARLQASPSKGSHFFSRSLLVLLVVRRFAPLADLLESFSELPLCPLGGGAIVNSIAQIVRQALHVRHLRLQVVRVLIAFTVPNRLHQPGRRIPQVQRDRLGRGVLDIVAHLVVRGVESIRLGREREINH